VWTVELIVMLAMIAVNGALAGYEIALVSVSVARLDALARSGAAGAKTALAMKRSLERSFAGVQLGITLAGAIAAATGGAGAQHAIVPLLRSLGVPHVLVSPLAIAIVVVPLTAVTLFFGELVPKIFALRNKEWVCLRLSPWMSWFVGMVRPVVWLLERSVTVLMDWWARRWRPRLEKHPRVEAGEIQDLRAAAALARMSKLIGLHAERIILNAVGLSTRPIREIQLPAEHIFMLDLNRPLAEALVAGHLDLHTRFPVTERPGDPQAISGYVNYKDIVAAMRLNPQEPSLKSILRPLLSFRDDAPLSACLEQLIREHAHIALVRQPSGKVLGMVTLEDIIEELVGEIQDEYDRLPAHAQPSGSAWVVGGGISLARLREATGIDLPSPSPPGPAAPQTLSQWFTQRFSRPLRGGEELLADGCRVAVRKVRRQQVYEAQISREPKAEDGRRKGEGGNVQ
jgi:putative hemolysin